MSDPGERIGYCLMTRELDDPRLALALIEFALLENVDGGLTRLIPNIVRSFKLDGVITRSDNLDTLKALAHFPLDIYHLIQVYEVIEAPSNGARVDAAVRRAKSGAFKPGAFMRPDDFDVFSPDLYHPERVVSRHEILLGNKVAGIGVIQKISHDTRSITVSIKPEFRRRGLGGKLVSSLASRIRADGARPVIMIKPEDEAGLRFLNHIKAESLFDLLRTRPRFHASPVYPAKLQD